MVYDEGSISNKSETVLAVLCLTFGRFGAHKFYAGKWKTGLVYLLIGVPTFTIEVMQKIGISLFDSSIIGLLLSYCMVPLILYDLYSIYSECAVDHTGKLIVSSSRKDELCGRTETEKFNDTLNIILFIVLFIIYCILFYVVLPHI